MPSHLCSGSGTKAIPTPPLDASDELIELGRAVTSHPPGTLARLICVEDPEPRISPALFNSRDGKSMKSRDALEEEAFRVVSSCAYAGSWFHDVAAIAHIATTSKQEAKALDFI